MIGERIKILKNICGVRKLSDDEIYESGVMVWSCRTHAEWQACRRFVTALLKVEERDAPCKRWTDSLNKMVQSRACQ